MKPVYISAHAREQMSERGASTSEVLATIRGGQREFAKRGRQSFRRDLPYNQDWNGRAYRTKQVLAIVVEQPHRLIVVTVYTFYF